MSQFVFNGKSSLDFHVGISGSGTYNAPERDTEAISIPGRNGDIIIDNGRFRNVDLVYPAYIVRSLSRDVEGLRNFLLANPGYCRLEDDYHPDEYRMAQYKGGLEVDTTTRNLSGTFKISFNCKPQRFLKSGDDAIVVTTDPVTVTNPTLYPAKPLIKFSGRGYVKIGDKTITVNRSVTSVTFIDCETMQVYDNGVNVYNDIVENGFPEIVGTMQVETDAIVELYPRWWRV